MSQSLRMLGIAVLLAAPGVQAAAPLAPTYQTVWLLGTDDDRTPPFRSESYNSNPAPGSATSKDDDYYFAGTYPDPVGVVAIDEEDRNVERALTGGDPRQRFHFPLSTAERSSDSRLRITIDLIRGGAWTGVGQPGFQTHDIELSLNGVPLGTWEGIHHETTLVVTTPAAAVNALAEDNILTIERSGGASGGYIQLDYLLLESDPDGLADGDGDGMPRWFEETYGLSDADPADAIPDLDGDGLDALAEFQAGTNPTDPDSDNDGLGDAAETASDPTRADSDGDGLPDGAELTTSPTDSDSDDDGYPDGYETELGSDPAEESSTPFPYAGSIGLQFVSELPQSVPLGPWERAGIVPSPHWNPTSRLPHWAPDDNPLAGSAGPLNDSRGQPTTLSASWSYRNATRGLHVGGGDERLLSGHIQASNSGSGPVPASVTLSGIPFASYDLIAYIGDSYPGHRGHVQLGADGATRRYFISDTAPPFPGWREATATSEVEIHEANFVRYRNLSGASQTITVEQLDNDAVAIHAIQVIDLATDSDGDSLPDSVEIEHGFLAAIDDSALDPDADGLSNLEEIQLGTDPRHPDSDNDGLADGDEAGHGCDPLDADSDDDTLGDGEEINGSPFSSLPDLADSDGDSFGDASELAAGSDPMDPASRPAPVPTWDPVTLSWRWVVDDIRVRWNHSQSLQTGYTPFELVVELDDGGWRNSIGMGLYRSGGVVTHRFRCIHGVFYENGEAGNSFYNTGSSSPENDRKAEIGLTGFGAADDSDPLRFEFIADRVSFLVNEWDLTFNLYNTADPANPVLVATRSWSGATAADDRLLNGTAPWTDIRGNPDVPTLDTEPGIDAFITRDPLGPADSDSDGMPDDWETSHSLDPNDPADAGIDSDGDGLLNREEFFAGTNPHEADSDGDGADDREELTQGSDPGDPASTPAWRGFAGTIDDLDGDGLSDAWTLWAGGKQRVAGADDDGDGMSNAEESEAGTDPDDPDSRLDLRATRVGDTLCLDWPDLAGKAQSVVVSEDFTRWDPATDLPPSTSAGGRRSIDIPNAFDDPTKYYRTVVTAMDSDGDGVEDWIEENLLFSSPSDADSLGPAVQRAGQPPLSGDARALLERVESGAYPGDSGPGTSPTPSPYQAARFLMQATFGPTLDDIAEVRATGFEAWIDHQLALPPSYHRPYIEAIQADAAGSRVLPHYDYNEGNEFVTGTNVTTPFARHAIMGEDQLRQRVAFALSQILVISRRDAQLTEKPTGVTDYYDLLVDHAFGDYAELLHDVALHPCMGWYLSHVGNQKADPSIPRYPDENFAREVMQLFSIGLWELNPDGTRVLDAEGQPVPTYDNAEITELARVFTGLYYDAPYGWGGGGWDDAHYTKPMVMYPEYHDFEPKHLPNGAIIPAREATAANGMLDVRDAIDALVNHPNTAPFISRQLIQFLVTDNPSPAYVGRVAAVFADDGGGRRGNLGAVVRAILLDPEARETGFEPAFGKVREPVIRTMHLGRLLKVGEATPDFVWWNPEGTYYDYSFQEPLSAPNVFNFFTPVYQAPGDIRNLGLVSPGFQIIDSYSAISFPNLLWAYLEEGFISGWQLSFPLDDSELLSLAGDDAALVERVNLLVCAGGMSANTRAALLDALTEPGLDPHDRVAVALWTAINSPEGATQN